MGSSIVGVKVVFERSTVAQGVQNAMARIVAAAPVAAAAARGPVSVAFCVDVSGSMDSPAGVSDVGQWTGAETKLARAKAAVMKALEAMGPDDEAALVAFSSGARVVFPMESLAVADARERFAGAVQSLSAGGGTALFAGWKTAGGQAALSVAPNRLCRVLLLTDGEATDGERNAKVLGEMTAGLAANGVSTSCFGVGASFSEDLLMAMAEGGQGNFFYIPDPLKTDEAVACEMDGAKAQAARGAVLKGVFPAGVSCEHSSGFAGSLADGVSVGNLLFGRPVDVLLKLDVSPEFAGKDLSFSLEVSWIGASGEQETVAETALAPMGDGSGESDPEVLGLAVSMEAANAKSAAVRAMSVGDYEGSMSLLQSASASLMSMPESYSRSGEELLNMRSLMGVAAGGDKSALRKAAVSQAYQTGKTRKG